MNIFEAYEQIEVIYKEFTTKVNEFISYYRENIDKKRNACISMCNASIKHHGRQPSINPYDSQYNDNTRKIILEARALSSYNVCNVLAWMKRYKRLENKFSHKYYQYRQAIKKANKSLEQLKEQLTPKQFENKTLLQRLEILEAALAAEEFGGYQWEKEDNISAVMFRSLFLEISKNDMLSLFSLRHDANERELIEKLPETITIKEFEEAAFFDRLEKDDDCIFFDIFFEDMMKALDANKEIKAKMFDKVQETFGPLPTYTAYTDGNDNVVKMKPNKPQLTVISNRGKEN